MKNLKNVDMLLEIKNDVAKLFWKSPGIDVSVLLDVKKFSKSGKPSEIWAQLADVFMHAAHRMAAHSQAAETKVGKKPKKAPRAKRHPLA